MATSNGELSVVHENGETEGLRELLLEKEQVISSLERRVKVLEREVGVVWERLGRMGEEKREQEMKMVLVQEQASRSLASMVAARQEQRREDERRRERFQQLEMQVGMQAEELGHLRAQLAEETAAHRQDVAETERRARQQVERLRLQLRRARGLGLSASQPSIPSHYNTLPPTSSHPHQPLLHTTSVGPPSYQQSTTLATPTPYQRAPATFHTGVATFHGHLCYFSSFMTTQIHVYDTALGAWQLLPRCPVTNFGLEVVKKQVTTIGGRLVTETSLCTSQLFSLSPGESEWQPKLPSMKLARGQPATTCNSRLLVVAGGEMGDKTTFIADIEVFDQETDQWSQLASSPLGNYSWLTAVICRDHLYLLEGSGARERDYLHTLHMGALVESIRDHTPSARPKVKRAGLPWKQVKSPPVSNTTCVCAKERLLVVGGIDTAGKTTSQVWAMADGGERWKAVGSLKSQRYRSLVSVTATGSLLVIGGLTKTRFTDHMEIFDAF